MNVLAQCSRLGTQRENLVERAIGGGDFDFRGHLGESGKVFGGACRFHVAEEECCELVHLDLDLDGGLGVCGGTGEILPVSAQQGARVVEPDRSEFVVSVIRDSDEIEFRDDA